MTIKTNASSPTTPMGGLVEYQPLERNMNFNIPDPKLMAKFLSYCKQHNIKLNEEPSIYDPISCSFYYHLKMCMVTGIQLSSPIQIKLITVMGLLYAFIGDTANEEQKALLNTFTKFAKQYNQSKLFNATCKQFAQKLSDISALQTQCSENEEPPPKRQRFAYL